MRTGKRLVAVLLTSWAAAAAAGPIALTVDMGVRGAFRHCEYSNGKVYLFDSGQTCPPSMQEPASNGKGIGIFRGESNEGTSKLCIYRVGGQERNIRIDIHAQCPLNQEF